MRKFCTLFVALALVALCVILLPTQVQAADTYVCDDCCGNLRWELDDEGTLVISGQGQMDAWPFENLTVNCTCSPTIDFTAIKELIIGDGIRSVGSELFQNCPNLTTVTLGSSMSEIGYRAFFGCKNLTSITFTGSNLDYIGVEAFENCYSLSSITIPEGAYYIGSNAFKGCRSLTSIIIPGSIGRIWNNTFADCTNLTSLTIGEGVTSIGDAAFIHCDSLTSVIIPDSVTHIGEDAFYGCDSLVSVIYCGTDEQWNEIDIGDGNTKLTGASRERHNLNESNIVTQIAPTYTAMGKATGVCEYCDEEIAVKIPAKFYGTSVNLGNTLDMYFGFYTGLVDENGTVKFVREFADGTTETTEAPITSFKKNNSVYDITYTGLAAKEMCDTIHVYVYNGEGTLVGQHSDSIRSYILRQLREKEYGQEFRTLCIDLLNYGAAAQETFGYNTGDLANKDLTAEELAEGTQQIATYTNKQTISGATDSYYYGTAYLLETKISMSMAVRASYFDDGCYALVSYTDHTGTEKNNIRLEGTKNNSVYEFFLNEIVVADGRCLLTIEFYKADGTKVVTVQDSMESYTARNAAVYPLAEKMLAFSDSAYKYLHRNDK